MNQDNLTFRAATAADIDAVVALAESAYRGDSGRRGWTTESDLLGGRRTGPDEVEVMLSKPRSMVLLGERGDPPALVACAHIAALDEVGYFGLFTVDPALQGAGIGKRVLDEAERIVRDDWRLSTIQMTVINVREELIQYYLRRGFRRTGKFLPFPYGDARFGLPKRDDLSFEVLEKTV
ncbi:MULTISPECIES: GNAT family N-acetyltransferase [unclassified Lysobacter]|uniref:GNAT family N-acetyltransferase n=1 Tax=unclassified Lysobacter TaxID=2635362 RepID=UPI001BE672AF|nr:MULTISPECIES: GNAT family N-acetyltransferase [unclassified Lysobacter]MBT2747387.1 GNAT family N-acetyltransferase [Lysobacter sp. ISL-42]MBT2750854.1 GNAT family N-acetyltransferase [Lysobacter sp. ISL-50]MBT2778315.1 GNAT family N-acetyltransferase [Lysobacter sp. ISL-54]MBT2784021.1 GNAT family N-acetyltransferase [Lysobacter sp. ISL-52]